MLSPVDQRQDHLQVKGVMKEFMMIKFIWNEKKDLITKRNCEEQKNFLKTVANKHVWHAKTCHQGELSPHSHGNQVTEFLLPLISVFANMYGLGRENEKCIG